MRNINMKLIIALTCLFALANAISDEFAAEIKQKMTAKVENCAKETGATADDVATIMSHKIPESHEGKCIYFCVHKKIGAQGEDGSLNIDKAVASVDMLKDVDAELHGKVVTAFKNCASTPTDSDPCIYGVKLAECIMKEAKAIGIDCLVQ